VFPARVACLAGGVIPLHLDEVAVDEDLVRRLVRSQFPELSGLALTPVSSGTDNRMLRLGDDLVVRLPRKPSAAGAVAKEHSWLPRLAPHLPLTVPEPFGMGRPGDGYPFPWSVYRWIDGAELDPEQVEDRTRLGRDLAGFVRALHGIEVKDARREGALSSYRGGSLRGLSSWVAENIEACRGLEGLDLDLAALGSMWQEAMEVDEPEVPHTWMHTDLKPSNLLQRRGRLVGVVDFGGLSVGDPTAEHAATWDLPAGARHAYADELRLDTGTRLRARAWALGIALSGVPYYWSTWPDFVEECLRRLRRILSDPDDL
jgi:aminoglycoside phosphotransferase (APT) family kinase protein